MPDRQKITCTELRESDVRGLLVYCADYPNPTATVAIINHFSPLVIISCSMVEFDLPI